MPGPLAGIRIFDMTRILAGPTATQILADLGADVIKVERPGTGDDVRAWGPPYLKDKDGREQPSESVYFNAANRNKRSMTLNLASREGQELALKLIAKCDVLFENYKVGDLAKYGLAYAQIKERFPRLVYCSLTGFGQTGPYAARAGFDLVVQAMGGIMSITGPAGGAPAKVGVGIADVMTGMYSNIAILAALRHRDLTGQGQHLDMALLDCQVAWLINEGMNYLHTGQVPKAWGTAHATIVPYQAYPTADGHFILAVGNDRQFRAFCEFADEPKLADDPRFKTNAQRVANRAACDERVTALTQQHPADHWIAGLSKRAVPCGPVNTIDKVFANPQVQARNMVVEIPHTASGKRERYIASPIKMSATPVEYRRGAPMVGEHTEEVVRELLGMDRTEVAKLREKGVV
ncbi:MAG TPA: CaiB/BaiF CoA-transferase family protein [Alphaproteobacteria bacterium]|jgi:crotonobetainyl-CoA:carnitine CoA-transferase CaiB-like acyl-CoA transferase